MHKWRVTARRPVEISGLSQDQAGSDDPGRRPPTNARRGRKFLQVLEGARRIFLRDGFDGASVDDITREAGVSKATLYSYFPDKRMMFMEVFRHEIGGEPVDDALAGADLPVEQVLSVIVQTISAQMTSEFGLRFFRVSVSEAERFPMLAREYYESGPALLRQRLIRQLERAVQRDELRIPDLELAADQLIQLACAGVQDRALFLGPQSVSAELLGKANHGAVAMFLACYGNRRGVAAD